MGQRHQIFAVAKINGRYRTIAVTHHQWMYGFDVLKRCVDTLATIRNNAARIERELKWAASLDWAKDVPKDRDRTSGPFFPFIATTLYLATGDGGANGGAAFIFLLSLNTEPADTINDDGFTVIDITDPSEPRYAFFFDAELVGPADYQRGYGPVHEAQRRAYNAVLTELHDVPQVEVNAVSELWPGDSWTKKSWPYRDVSAPAQHDVAAVTAKLKDVTMARVVQEAMSTAPDQQHTWMDATMLSDFRSALRTILRETPEKLHPAARVSVLGLAFEDCDVVDLLPFEGLQPEELLAIVQHLGRHDSTRKLSITLPNMCKLTAFLLNDILSAANISSIDLGATAVSIEAQFALVNISRVSCVRSPSLYKQAFEVKQKGSTSGFGGTLHPSLPSTSYPNGDGTSFPLSQLIYFRQHRASRNPRLAGGGLDWRRMLQSWSADASLGGVPQSSSEHKPPNILVMPLRDALLSKGRIPAVVPKLLKYSMQTSDRFMRPGCFPAGDAIGLAMSVGLSQDDRAVWPIPAEPLTAHKTTHCSTSNPSPMAFPWTPGSWSLLVVHEYSTSASLQAFGPHCQPEVRYALVTTTSEGEAKCADAETFFGEDAKSWECWMHHLESLTSSMVPDDIAEPGHGVQRGRISAASSAESHGLMKVVEKYNERIAEHARESLYS